MKFIEELKKSDFFKTLDPAELSSLIATCGYYMKTYGKEVVIKEESENVKDLAIILHGKVTVSKSLPSGEKTVISILSQGASFGEAVIPALLI